MKYYIPEDIRELVRELVMYEEQDEHIQNDEEVLERLHAYIMPEEKNENHDESKEESEAGNVIIIDM